MPLLTVPFASYSADLAQKIAGLFGQTGGLIVQNVSEYLLPPLAESNGAEHSTLQSHCWLERSWDSATDGNWLSSLSPACLLPSWYVPFRLAELGVR